ncbi:hypothetical protein B0H13DRAFT_2150138, partial [Mycena leptocephala]
AEAWRPYAGGSTWVSAAIAVLRRMLLLLWVREVCMRVRMGVVRWCRRALVLIRVGMVSLWIWIWVGGVWALGRLWERAGAGGGRRPKMSS